MTAQAYECLRIDGVDYYIATCPLEPWLDKLAERPWKWRTTALYRGYIGTWRIEDRRLWLDEIAVEECDDRRYMQPVPVPDGLFPGYAKLPVPAWWFTGQLRVPIGEEILYVHHGFGSQHERLRLIRIEEGRVRSDRTYDNLARIRRRMAGEPALAEHFAAQKQGEESLKALYAGRVRPMFWFTEVELRRLGGDDGGGLPG